MKTIAILLFSALALSACATDEQSPPDELGAEGGAGIDTNLDGAAADFAQQLLNDHRHVDVKLDGQAGDWAEEILLGDKVYLLIHGLHGDARLIDSDGQPVVCRACDRL